ncbi:MAG: threonine/serine dehydratase [Mycobacterium sp.]
MLLTARKHVSQHAYHTPLLTSRLLSEATGYDVRLKAECFQRTGSYKFRGPLNKIAQMTPDQRARGVICSSAGNHSQGVALAARINDVRAVVVMAQNATPSKIAATKSYGAEVVLHGSIWDEANDKALELVESEGLTYIHPFDDLDLIAGQGSLGMEIIDDFPDVDAVVVPIGGGGLISGVSSALKAFRPESKIIGVESSDGPAMQRSLTDGTVRRYQDINTIIDGLRVQRVGQNNFSIVRDLVDDIVTLPDSQIFEALVWVMSHAKVVVEGAAAAPVGALLQGLIDMPPGCRVACVLSGGNLDLRQLEGMRWN